ncbi:MAG: MBL fold metallo-hydrolase [Bacteroidales bacterium]|nr:MBL fold metallo-hydrolase [Bacteroidales bacterium]
MIQIDAIVFNSFQVNTYLIWDETGDCLVVDPAFYTREEQEIFDAFLIDKQLKLTGQVNTHCHIDHILGVQHIKSQYDCPFSAHEEEAILVTNAPLSGDMFGLSFEPISGIDRIIVDHDIIKVGNHSLQSIRVPGHSMGSLSYYSPEGGFVITGDALFEGGIGRTDLPGGNYDQLIQSIRTRLLVLPPETIVYPGHGPSSTIGKEIGENPFLFMAE